MLLSLLLGIALTLQALAFSEGSTHRWRWLWLVPVLITVLMLDVTAFSYKKLDNHLFGFVCHL